MLLGCVFIIAKCHEHSGNLKRCCNVLPVFGFISAKYDLNLIKSYLIPILVRERDIEPTTIKKANTFISFQFSVIQLLDIMFFLMEQRVLIHSWTHTRLQKQKDSFPTCVLITMIKWRIQNCPRMRPSLVNFVAVILLKQTSTTMLSFWKVGWLQNKPFSFWNWQNHHLQEMKTIDSGNNYGAATICSFKILLGWYKNRDNFPTLKAMQKLTVFYHDKDINMSKLGCTLPNLAYIFPHKSTDTQLLPLDGGR